MAEHKARQRQIFARNNANPAVKQNMEFKRGQLFVKNKPYQKKVKVPEYKQLLTMDSGDMRSISQISLADGGSSIEKGSRFVGYACKANDLKTIRKAYIHIKRLHPDASHVSMAYRLAGTDKAYDEDYVDDREHSARRKLLNQLIKDEQVDIVFFVVRFYGGIHIGAACFDIHQRLIKQAIAALEKGEVRVSKLPLKQYQESPRKAKKPRSKSVKGKANLPPSMAHSPTVCKPTQGMACRAALFPAANQYASSTFNRFTYLRSLSQSSTEEKHPTNYNSQESVEDGFRTVSSPRESW